MAPPERPFHVSELPQRVHARLDQMGQLKSRRLPQDFELKKDCELMELVQYSCTPWQESISMSLEGKRQECRPVVRLFRR
jgi:Mitochondrial export protein Som1